MSVEELPESGSMTKSQKEMRQIHCHLDFEDYNFLNEVQAYYKTKGRSEALAIVIAAAKKLTIKR